MKTSMSIRAQQFDEMVKRSLYDVSVDLEQDQTYQYLEEDMIESENRYSQYNQPHLSSNMKESTSTTITHPDGSETRIEQSISEEATTQTGTKKSGIFISPK
ncbi:MAG TPA: two-component sensor histidine kinase, partial [Porphyromonadaceae bacterium]|nr:two-component sensor histidine kinase [Porphyromonadaceae bacterium]